MTTTGMNLLDDVDMSELGEEAEESPSEQVAQSMRVIAGEHAASVGERV